MIGSEQNALIDSRDVKKPPLRLGGPLAMLSLLLTAWITGRSVLWESPFPASQVVTQAAQLLGKGLETDRQLMGSYPLLTHEALMASRGDRPGAQPNPQLSGSDHSPKASLGMGNARLASAHASLWQAALMTDLRGTSWRFRTANYEARRERQAQVPVFPGTPPFLTREGAAKTPQKLDRWSLGAWVFGRQGSNALRITQGPAPVYGASQMGAILQYRAAPNSPHDPRVFVRGARALIDEPETEVALGVSARPVEKAPVRFAAEVRGTYNRFTTDLRPAAYAITELPPVSLPLQFSAEVYAAGGYVGGDAQTAFIDGQASVTHRLASFDLNKVDDVRLSVGGGAWGGAQSGAHRLDVGPSLRVDMAVGPVPARFSIDYRERVAGDAAPVSGVAATLSTQF